MNNAAQLSAAIPQSKLISSLEPVGISGRSTGLKDHVLHREGVARTPDTKQGLITPPLDSHFSLAAQSLWVDHPWGL